MRVVTMSPHHTAGKPRTAEESDVMRRVAEAGATTNEIADQLCSRIVISCVACFAVSGMPLPCSIGTGGEVCRGGSRLR
jgi:hypothetical protein